MLVEIWPATPSYVYRMNEAAKGKLLCAFRTAACACASVVAQHCNNAKLVADYSTPFACYNEASPS
jgi:hypothetical protein